MTKRDGCRGRRNAFAAAFDRAMPPRRRGWSGPCRGFRGEADVNMLTGRKLDTRTLAQGPLRLLRDVIEESAA